MTVMHTQSCQTFRDPMHCSPRSSSVHGIFQERILEWVAISFIRGSFQHWDQTCVSCMSCTGRRVLYQLRHWGGPCCVESLSHVQLLVTPWTVACQAPLSMGILQARILEWVFMPSFSESSQPRGWIRVSHIAGRFFTIWAIKETQEDWSG